MLAKIHLLTLTVVHDLKAKRDDRGATAVEYALLVSLIAAVIVASVTILGGQVAAAFQPVVDGLE